MRAFICLVPLLAGCIATVDESEDTSAICVSGDCGGPTEPLPHYDYYCGMPEIRFAQIADAHECDSTSALGCGRAFMYFGEAGTEKTGNLPSRIGSDLYDTNVWASNFQGPYLVSDSRQQFEWGTSFSSLDRISSRVYPALYATSCAAVSVGGAPAAPLRKWLHVYEDDEWINPDDYVGGAAFDESACVTDVWSKGLAYGWTGLHSATVSQDVGEVTYRTWCWRCLDATTCSAHGAPGITF